MCEYRPSPNLQDILLREKAKRRAMRVVLDHHLYESGHGRYTCTHG